MVPTAQLIEFHLPSAPIMAMQPSAVYSSMIDAQFVKFMGFPDVAQTKSLYTTLPFPPSQMYLTDG